MDDVVSLDEVRAEHAARIARRGTGLPHPHAREALASRDLLRADAVLDALSELERDPRLGHELRGRLTGLRSYRVGVYRIIYELRDDRTLRVVANRHRGSHLRDGPR